MYEIIKALGILINIYTYLLIAYILIGYFPEARGSGFYRVLERICEPLLRMFRFAQFSGISLAPMFAILFLQFIYKLIIFLYGGK